MPRASTVEQEVITILRGREGWKGSLADGMKCDVQSCANLQGGIWDQNWFFQQKFTKFQPAQPIICGSQRINVTPLTLLVEPQCSKLPLDLYVWNRWQNIPEIYSGCSWNIFCLTLIGVMKTEASRGRWWGFGLVNCMLNIFCQPFYSI